MKPTFVDGFAIGVLFYAVYVWCVTQLLRFMSPERRLERVMRRETRKWQRSDE